jgi:hypothetical protein
MQHDGSKKSDRSDAIMPDPTRSRPHIEGYGIPKTKKGMLEWSAISQRLAEAQTYWIATVTPDGRPHTIPTWGVWLDDVFYFGGGLQTRHMRNIAQNPAMTLHLESGTDAVIVEGDVVRVEDREEIQRSDRAGKVKYGMGTGGDTGTEPVFAMHPRKAFAWIGGLGSATRWVFE